MHKKISIIVLTYNVGDYLRECINSIINQTYHNLEIILVDDGSKDNSVKIGEEFRQKDMRIRLIQQENSGAGPVRNLGVNVATGEYIMFVDGDDILAKDMVEKLYKQIEDSQADIACCLFYRVDEKNNYYFYSNPHNPEHSALEGSYSSRDWLTNEIRPVIGQVFYQAWGKLFKRTLFKNIEYPFHSYGDDGLTSWKLYLAANKITYINYPGYCWRIRFNSITTGKNPNIKSAINNALSVQERIQFYRFIGIDSTFLKKRELDFLQKQRFAGERNNNLSTIIDAKGKIKILRKYSN